MSDNVRLDLMISLQYRSFAQITRMRVTYIWVDLGKSQRLWENPLTAFDTLFKNNKLL